MKLMSESLDTIGIMARGVADCALLGGVLAGLDLGDPDARAPAPKVGLCWSPMKDRAGPETAPLRWTGSPPPSRRPAPTVRPHELPPAYSGMEAAHKVVMNAESARAMGWELAHHREKLSPTLRENLEWGASQTGAALAEAPRHLPHAAGQFPRCHGRLRHPGHPPPRRARRRRDSNGPATPRSTSSGPACTSPASPCPPERARTACRSASRSSAPGARTPRYSPGQPGSPPRSPDHAPSGHPPMAPAARRVRLRTRLHRGDPLPDRRLALSPHGPRPAGRGAGQRLYRACRHHRQPEGRASAAPSRSSCPTPPCPTFPAGPNPRWRR